MKSDLSRRDFLAAGLAVPAAGLRTSSDSPLPHAIGQAKLESARLDYRMLGKTGLKVKLLTARLEDIGPLYCRMCGACGGVCERGVPVPDVLRFLTYAEGYGQFALGREKFLQLGPEVGAVRCADCEHCTVQCPYGVQVVARLRHAQEWFA